MAGISKSLSKRRLDQKEEIRFQAENDLEFAIRLVHPQRVLGEVHKEYIRWITRQDKKSHQLVLLPRDHQKSAILAYYAWWCILRDPTVRIIYISSTANLAIKQLGFIKDLLTHPICRRYWPDMVHEQEGKRTKWSETEIAVDHPLRKAEAIRDSTVYAAGLTTNTTGLHCDKLMLDDIVVFDNAYTEDGRNKTEQQYSLLSSVQGTDAELLATGTRYFPKDIYSKMTSMMVQMYNDDGDLTGEEPLYETFERQVEDRGDGTGQYLWPRQQRSDGKWFGFNQAILERKRAEYIDTVQFRAQYYNDPNDPDGAGIDRSSFQYYEPKFLERQDGHWFYKQARLNVFAAVDFAFSLARKADYTSIVVVGIDKSKNYYVLDIDRFKTDQISDYFNHILRLHQKWDFRKIRAEINVAQKPIVESLKKDYIRVHGLALSIDEVRPNRHEGTKQERITAILQPKYRNGQVFHYLGGHCQSLEEELILSKPPHDDIKDALASAVDVAIAPSFSGKILSLASGFTLRQNIHPTFGGVA